MAQNYDDLYESQLVDVDGNKIGNVCQVYLDDQTGLPTWITVQTGLFGRKETFVPLDSAIITEGKIQVPFTQQFVKDAPNVDPDRHLDAVEEAELCKYFGLGNETDPSEDLQTASQPNSVTGESDSDGVEPEGYTAHPEHNSPARAQSPAAPTTPSADRLSAPAQPITSTIPPARAAQNSGFVPSPVLVQGPFAPSASPTPAGGFQPSPVPVAGPYGQSPEVPTRDNFADRVAKAWEELAD
uniref:PRC-barrel domain-containing protein n=1 Tax=Vaginimicrobium propionicum TaxID=1871034 RepID=UPI000970FA41|nr:PRC-barrel domain-containing protein [Vaginimicrobium propionicum]